MPKVNLFNKQTGNLLRELVISDFKLRYQNSILGYLWSIVRPLALFTILYVVFAKFFRFGEAIPLFPAYLLLGIVLWTFFIEATNNGLRSIVDRGELIRKVSIPKYTIVLSAAISSLANLFINLIVVGFFLIITNTAVSTVAILVFPLLIIELLVLATATSYLLAALYVKYRDIAFIWELGAQVLFYATPIIYPLNLVPANFLNLVVMSPLAQIFQDARQVLVTPDTLTVYEVLPGWQPVIPFLVVIAVSLLATSYFKKQAPKFAENI